VFERALEFFDVGASAACMIGDNLEADIAAARGLGIATIWHDAHGVGSPAPASAAPDRVIASLSELLRPPERSAVAADDALQSLSRASRAQSC
jgi:FMN phosphatase YigB (HAD superfamily)